MIVCYISPTYNSLPQYWVILNYSLYMAIIPHVVFVGDLNQDLLNQDLLNQDLLNQDLLHNIFTCTKTPAKRNQ